MDESYIAVIGFQASILREIDIESTSQFFELWPTNGWLVDIFSFFNFSKNTTFLKSLP